MSTPWPPQPLSAGPCHTRCGPLEHSSATPIWLSSFPLPLLPFLNWNVSHCTDTKLVRFLSSWSLASNLWSLSFLSTVLPTIGKCKFPLAWSYKKPGEGSILGKSSSQHIAWFLQHDRHSTNIYRLTVTVEYSISPRLLLGKQFLYGRSELSSVA